MNNAAQAKGKLRILLVAYCFPPMNSIASHRPYGWARAWGDLGHEVHVLTPAKRGFDGPMDLQLDLAGIELHEVAYLRDRAPAAPASAPGEARRAQRWERLKTATRRARFSLAMFGDPRMLAYFALVREGLRIVRASRFDFIVATSPPEVSFFAARTLSRRTGLPWVADFRDLWFHDMRLQQSRFASWLSGVVLGRVIRSAAALVTVSVGLQRRLSESVGREVLLCYSGLVPAAPQSSPAARPWSDDRIHVVYTGRVYPGRQDPEPVLRALDALRSAPDPRGRTVVVDFYGHENPWLRALVAQYRLGDLVRLHGFVPHHESIAAQRAADALLFLEWTDPRADGMLGGKLFEYLGSARPILHVGRRKDTEVATLIAETGGGVTLTDEQDITGWLRTLAARAPLPDVELTTRDRLSRQEQARALLEALQSQLFRAAVAPTRHGAPQPDR